MIYRCSNAVNSTVSLLPFPNNPDLRREIMNGINKYKGLDRVLCSEHLTKDCFELNHPNVWNTV